MTLQTPEPLREWRLNATNREAYGLVTTMLDQIDMQPPYQRGAVWTTDQRIALIRSWIMGIPVPAIILNNRDNDEWTANEGSIYADGHRENFQPCWSVVDGKQRLETVGRRFVGRSFHLPMVEAKLPNLRGEAELYLLINGGGTPHSDTDMLKARALAGVDMLQIGALSDHVVLHCESRCPDPRHTESTAPQCVITTPHGWDHQDEYGHTWTTETVEVLT